ncbi:myc target protein 1 homolog [Brienomyrus brachyistius]|uniref:myc target protein 1 homolog n=1 Tax=Brienomyrus brachyistius TaxID=42636 RepID=UPI0020B2302B|nr:myc target protein 1 homolog [Brienomyrus brachyistius]
MAQNQTDFQWDFLKSPFVDKLILAFCLSILIGFLLGALIYVFMTWMSRRRASVRITRRPARQSRSLGHNVLHSRPAFARTSGYDRRSNNSLAGAAFSFHRQTSLEQADPLGRKPSFHASTFHPLQQCVPSTNEVQQSGHTSPTAAHNCTPPQQNSFWPSSSPRRLHMTQTSLPVYNNVIRAFQESRT